MIWKLLIVLAIILLVFGPSRISKLMSEMGKGIKGFKDGLNNSEEKKE